MGEDCLAMLIGCAERTVVKAQSNTNIKTNKTLMSSWDTPFRALACLGVYRKVVEGQLFWFGLVLGPDWGVKVPHHLVSLHKLYFE